jgi:dTDP-4-amino-4,6-dideoxygalactose transaminase
MTDEIAAREVTLPLYPGMTDENVFQVAQAVSEACKVSLEQ